MAAAAAPPGLGCRRGSKQAVPGRQLACQYGSFPGVHSTLQLPCVGVPSVGSHHTLRTPGVCVLVYLLQPCSPQGAASHLHAEGSHSRVGCSSPSAAVLGLERHSFALHPVPAAEAPGCMAGLLLLMLLALFARLSMRFPLEYLCCSGPMGQRTCCCSVWPLSLLLTGVASAACSCHRLRCHCQWFDGVVHQHKAAQRPAGSTAG